MIEISKSIEELVLDYRPEEPVKTVKINFSEDNAEENLSTSAKTLLEYKPSSSIKALDSVIRSGENILDDIDTETLKGYEAKNTIDEDTNPEIFNEIKNTVSIVEKVKEIYLKSNYGNGVKTVEEAEDIDTIMLRKVKELENSGQDLKINYFSIYVDSQLGSVVYAFAESMANYMEKLKEALDSKEVLKMSKDFEDVLLKTFDKTVEKSKEDFKALNKTREKNMLEKALVNSYIKKNTANKIFDKSNSISYLPDTETVAKLQDTIRSYGDEAVTSIIELYKIVQLNRLYCTNYITSLKDKKTLRNIYDNSYGITK